MNTSAAEPARTGRGPAALAWSATPLQPGAVAIIELAGDVEPAIAALTGNAAPPVGGIRLADLAAIDRGLIIRPAADRATLTPHGGIRVVERLLEWLAGRNVGLVRADQVDPVVQYPEAADRWEALTLAALARAASPMAIDLLLRQPERWRQWIAARTTNDDLSSDDLARSARLNRLLDPPLVVVAGLPNVGKSTLTNRLAGRRVSIEADLPGTTRDYTAARLELAGLVVNWIDTPGLLASPGELDAAAIATARTVIEQADLLIALTDDEQPWPAIPRPADLRIANKADRGQRSDADAVVSARTGEGVDQLVTRVVDRLIPRADRDHAGPWLFDSRLT